MSSHSAAKVGVYVDNANLYMNGGAGMRYDVLREFACRDDAEPVRLNVYASFDADRAENDAGYRNGHNGFCSSLRDFGYKVILKRIKWYRDEAGNPIPKANVDMEMAVDAILQSESIDRVLLATGDAERTTETVRRRFAALTPAGRRLIDRAFTDHMANERRLLDQLTPQEADELERLLAKWLAGFETGNELFYCCRLISCRFKFTG